MLTPERRPVLPILAVLAALLSTLPSCNRAPERPILPRSQTWAELRTVRREVTVTPAGEAARAPYPRERLVDGEAVHVGAEGLAWLRRDAGTTLLVRGPAELTLRSDVIELTEGRVFVDTPAGLTTELVTPTGPLHLSHVRASLDVSAAKSTTEAYVLAGEVRAEGPADGNKKPLLGRATAGERLVLAGPAGAVKSTTSAALTWEDWTGGLATTDRAAEPSPYGVGTVGARRPGDQGSPRFPLAIQRLDVRVTVVDDFAVTEVDELFFNPSSEVVEGLYRFRTPEGATLHRFGVDRDGMVVWGRVKEKQAAAAQYQANVYQGSTEDPALLEWDAPGVYRARLYPIGPGDTRRVVVRYAEWLGRTGSKGERRLYVYPMAADGAEESLPHIEELYASIDLARAGAKDVRVGMTGVREGDRLLIREHDFVPRADLAVELFDGGQLEPRGYTAPHLVDLETLPPSERPDAQRRARTEADYLLVPIRAADLPLRKGGLDLAIVVDTSAATETASLAIARAATAALLSHLGKDDRVVVWAGDAGLRPVVPGRAGLAPIDEAGRRAILTSLAEVERGGATDLGAMLTAAAAALDPERRGAVVYIGDGTPTVGEADLKDLRERLAKLPRPVRVFGLGVGDTADLAILKGLARGAFAERIGDANAAARAALRLLEAAERPAWLGAAVDLGPSVERIFPRDLSAIVADESVVVIGRVAKGGLPAFVTLTGPGGVTRLPLHVTPLDDHGDLARRWAEGRLAQMLDEATGRAAMVDLGSRNGIITPVTSLYVPTKREMTADERAELEKARQVVLEKAFHDRQAHEQSAGERSQGIVTVTASPDVNAPVAPWGRDDSTGKKDSDKEGGTGTRAKGEEGSMGNPASARHRYADAISGDSRASAASAEPPPVATAAAAAVAVATPPAEPMPAAAPGPQPSRPMFRPSGSAARPAEEKAKETKEEATAAKSGETHLSRQAALREASEFGMIGLLAGLPDGAEGDLPALVPGAKDANDLGGFGNGGLGLGALAEGEAGGGRGEGIGLGAIGTIGHGAVAGSGNPVVAGDGKLASEASVLRATLSQSIVTSKLPPAKQKSAANPADGWYEHDGRLAALQHADVGNLLQGQLQHRLQVTLRVGDVPHAAMRCGSASMVPFDERIGLWRERLARVAGNAQAVAATYRRALSLCEAPSYRERAKLLSMALDVMPTIPGRVQLWRAMFNDLGAADALYRGILARVRTPQEMRALHDAMGLASIDPGVLADLLKKAPTPALRLKTLRSLAAQWPDDFNLALRLLDALDDARDDAGARELGRKLRARPDADARLRTAVGELYLRLADRAATPEQRALDEGEARRAFGEIVEFAPEDPIARRRLGDLYRAHGWFADAARQYETLARLAPDDMSVALLRAAAAEGLGKLEEAVKWTEAGGAAGSLDEGQGPARTARAFAATYLAWGRLAALEGNRKEEAENLAVRMTRVLSTERTGAEALRGTRVTLTWAHPELHPTLWSNALRAPMPAQEGDVMLGVASVVVPRRDGAFVEVRLEPDELEHAARLGATAVLTAVFDQGTPGEVIVKRPVRFARDGAPTRRFALAAGELNEVTP